MIDVEHGLAAAGLAVLAATVFAESGLLIGFFLVLSGLAPHRCSAEQQALGALIPSLTP